MEQSCSKNRGSKNKNKKGIFLTGLYEDYLNSQTDFGYKRQSFYITGIYFIFGFLWVLLSDKIVEFFIDDKGTITLVSMLKGWIYVFLTSGLIYLLIFSAMKKIRTINDELKQKVMELEKRNNEIMSMITKTLSEKDLETEEHAERLKMFSVKLGRILGLSKIQLNELEIFALLHDVGKIAISDTILNKCDKLNDEEWEIMKKHSEIGYRILKSVPELSNIAEYVLAHHERWDGKGYPKGLKGQEIPLLSRAVAIVDAYDAMTNDRPYRKAMTDDHAKQELLDHAGTQFDPEIISIFVEKVL